MKNIRFSRLFDKRSRNSALYYAAAFLIPYLLLMAVHLYLSSGHGIALMGALQPAKIIWNGLASVCFAYYMKHTKAFYMTSVVFRLLLTVSYGMCGYGIAQESYLPALCLYALCPLVFFTAEQMFTQTCYRPFIVAMALALIIHPDGAIPLFWLLIVLCVTELNLCGSFSFGAFMHQLGCFLLSFLLASFRIFPYLELVVSNSYSGFSLSYPPLLALSRLLPFGVPSIGFNSPQGFDIYMGLFALLPLFAFFVCGKISARKRLAYGLFTLLMIGVITVSPLRFVFSLGASDGRYGVFCSYMLIFWLLRLAAEGLSFIRELSKKESTACLALTLLVVLASYIGYSGNFTAFALPATLAMLICIGLILFPWAASQKVGRARFAALLILLAAELTCNALVCTDLTFLPSERSLSASYPWTTTGNASDSAENADPAKDAYDKFMSGHSGGKDMERIDALYDTVALDVSEYKEYCGTSTPNDFERLNGLARKAGVSGDLFTPVSATAVFEPSALYSVKNVTESVYQMAADQTGEWVDSYYAPFELVLKEETSGDLYVSNDATGDVFCFTQPQQQGSLKAYTSLINYKGAGLTFRLLTYTLNSSVLDQLPEEPEDFANLLSATQEDISEESATTWIISGMVLSCIGMLIFLSLYFNSDKQKVYDFLLKKKKELDRWAFPHMLSSHLSANSMYYIGFLVPFLTYLIGMVMTDCMPFGPYSIFDEDGIALTLPNYMDCYYNLKIGNTYLSTHGGYCFSQYSNHPLIQIMSFYRLLRASQLPALLMLGEAFCIGLCGLSMAYYMTHRLLGLRVKKTDGRLLAPILIYSLNAYMISMHSFSGWYFSFAAFPLVVTALDYLLYKKKKLPYILLLSFCILANVQLSMYMCIFLVIYFFTCYFKDFRDFLTKGVRFALCSVLAAGNGFFVISSTLLGASDSPYKDRDAALPSPGLNTSFLEQWKKHMLFTDVNAISTNDGMINIYCSILLLILLLIYFSSRQISLRAKLRKLVPIAFLYISFNGKLLSYLWNGLHYQVKVPNRYVFLLLFLLAELSYDAIRHVGQISALRFAGISGIVCIFFICCQFGSDGNSRLSFAASLIVCGVYLLCCLLLSGRGKQTQTYSRALILLMAVEICVNAVYSFHQFGTMTITLYGDISSTKAYIEEKREQTSEYFRTSFAALPTGLINNGMNYNTDTIALFNSFVTNHQNRLSEQMGFYGAGNNTLNKHNSTPFSMMLTCTRYIFVPYYAMYRLDDLSYYRYLGMQDIYYVFENPRSLSLGIYVPYEAAGWNSDNPYPPDFYNNLAKLLTDSEEPIFAYQDIAYSSDGSQENSYCFVDLAGELIPEAEAQESLAQYRENPDNLNRSLNYRFRFMPANSGYTYFMHDELISLGHVTEGEETTVDVNCTGQPTAMVSTYTLATLNEAALDAFYERAKQNQLEHIEIGNNRITGTTDFAEDGYTMLNIAYDKSWHAYIDGAEVEVEDPYGSMIFVKTPAGKHTLTLEYIPYGMKLSKGISFIFWLLTACLFGIPYAARRRRAAQNKTITE